jgi:hypothetical protein
MPFPFISRVTTARYSRRHKDPINENIQRNLFGLFLAHWVGVRGAFSLCAAQEFRVTCIDFTYEKTAITHS